MIDKLAVAITFFYNTSRLHYLKQITTSHARLAQEVTIFIVTNTSNSKEIDNIKAHSTGADVHIVTPSHLGHPYLLTWAHRAIFKDCLTSNEGYTHFLYTEDDILVKKHNIEYWLKDLQSLNSINGIPGFVRYELDAAGRMLSTDITEDVDFRLTPKIKCGNRWMVSMPIPYQGMYLLTADQTAELLFTEAGSPDTGGWQIREKAAQGLTYWNVPRGANSRHFVGLTSNYEIDPGALIHHLPNNYALDPKIHFASIEIKDVIRRDPLPLWLLRLPYSFLKRRSNYLVRAKGFLNRQINKSLGRLAFARTRL